MNLDDIKKKLIFLAGDIRREKCIGGFAWGKYEHFLDYDESMFSILYANEGYIGLHRNRGDLSNVGVPGFMKHAWIYTGGNYIVEAVSEGVLKRNHLHASHGTDYLLILEPIISREVQQEAAKKALYLSELNLPYDDHFKFNLEINDSLFADKDIAQENMKTFDIGMTCSEVSSVCYVGHRRELGIFRTKLGKREVVLPDAFISTHFKIRFASKYTTPEVAKSFDLGEEGCTMIEEYWKERK
jgi:hypothetical protein